MLAVCQAQLQVLPCLIYSSQDYEAGAIPSLSL